MGSPVKISEQDSRALGFITKNNIEAGQNISNAGAIGGMAFDFLTSLLSIIPVGGAAVGAAKEGVKVAKEGVKAAKEGVKLAKAAGEGISAAQATLKAARTVGVVGADGILKPGLAVARQGVQAAKASTLGFKVANKTLAYGKVGAGLVGNYGAYKSAVASGDTTEAVKAGLGAGDTVTRTTISEVREQQSKQA